MVILSNSFINFYLHFFTPGYLNFVNLSSILYGEVNSVKNTTINIRLNDGVY